MALCGYHFILFRIYILHIHFAHGYILSFLSYLSFCLPTAGKLFDILFIPVIRIHRAAQ